MPPKPPPPFTNPPVQTRATNKSAHPGAVHKSLDTTRRTTAQVKAAKAKEAAEKKAAEKKQELALASAARIEDKQQEQDDTRKTASSKLKLEIPSFRPAIPNPDIISKDLPVTFIDADKPEARPVRDVFQKSALINDAMDSDDSDKDQYQPEEPEFESEDSDEEQNMTVDLEEDNDNTATPKAAKAKKGKPGRADVRAARKTVPTTASAQPQQDSVKGPPPAKKPKKSNDPPSGLLKDWDQPAKTKSKPTASKKPVPAPAADSNGIEDDLMTRYGGLVGDNDDDSAEQSAAVEGKSGSAKRPNLVKIIPAKLAPTTKKEARGGANKWTLADLPEGTSTTFSEVLVPLAKLKAGSKSPWSGLETSEVQDLVDEVFGKHYKVDEGGVWSDLIGYRLSNWRNAFATAAIAGIKMYLDETAAEYFPTPADKAEWVNNNLKGFGDPPTYPFHWKIFDADEDVINKKCQTSTALMVLWENQTDVLTA